MASRFAFIANNEENIAQMLTELGYKTLEDLFNDIPLDLKVKKRPEIK